MFTRITESGGHHYLQIVESFRNEMGKPRLRVVANLGRVDGMKEGHLDAHIGDRTFNDTSNATPEQLSLFDALNIPRPA